MQKIDHLQSIFFLDDDEDIVREHKNMDKKDNVKGNQYGKKMGDIGEKIRFYDGGSEGNHASMKNIEYRQVLALHED